MKKILVVLLLAAQLPLSAQTGDSTVVPAKDSPVYTPIDMEQNARNLNHLVNTINERKRKEQQRAWLRIGFGVLILGIGAYGLLRKKKTAK